MTDEELARAITVIADSSKRIADMLEVLLDIVEGEVDLARTSDD